MQFTASTLLALAAIIPFASAHMRVNSPPIYASPQTIKEGEFLNPLSPDGSNYPCYDTEGLSPAGSPETVYQAGSEQRFVIGGSAVHGGGSCQISITYDVPVNKGSKFYVLKSYHGDCPVNAGGNLNYEAAVNLGFRIPSDIPSGKASLAWTWFNRVGNREMYMRCAPVTIKSDTTSKAGLHTLPPMFKANILNIGADSCVLPEGSLFRFPNPGKDVHTGSGVTLLDVPAGCGASTITPTPSEPEPQPVESEVVIIETDLPAGDDRPNTPVYVGNPPANPPKGGDKPSPINAPVPTVTVVPVEPKPKPETPAKPIPSSGRCKEDGAIICTSANTWAICDHGAVVPMGSVAGGMVCKGGVMEFAKSKRAVRGMKFGHEHRRRHHKRAL